MPKPGPRFAIMASGRGSNAAALMDAFTSLNIDGEVVLLLSNKESAGALQEATHRKIPAKAIPHQGLSRPAHEDQLLSSLAEFQVDHLLLAGYMRILTPHFIQSFPGRILNIHPSLLPDYKGIKAIERQWQDKVQVAGATVHEVIPEVDSGPIVLQGSFEPTGQETFEVFRERMQREVEHIIYPRAVWLFVSRLTHAQQEVSS